MGKAARSMAAALEAQFGSGLEGIVASSPELTSQVPASQVRGFRYFRGGHPTPTDESILAAGAILNSLIALDSTALVIFMISGGGSSIVEKPVVSLNDDEISLPDLVATYRTLFHSAAPLPQTNPTPNHLPPVNPPPLPHPPHPPPH